MARIWNSINYLGNINTIHIIRQTIHETVRTIITWKQRAGKIPAVVFWNGTEFKVKCIIHNCKHHIKHTKEAYFSEVNVMELKKAESYENLTPF